MRRETMFAMNLVMALVLIGLVMAYSAGIGRPQPAAAGGQISNPMHYLQTQAAYAVLGLVCMLVAARIDYHFWQARPVYWLLAGASLATLALVMVMGEEVRGARRWLNLFGVGFQPSEIAK